MRITLLISFLCFFLSIIYPAFGLSTSRILVSPLENRVMVNGDSTQPNSSANLDSAWAMAIKMLPSFDLLPDSLKKLRDPVAKMGGKKVKFSEAMTKHLKPVRPVGSWTDSLNALKAKLVFAPSFIDTLLECLSYCRRTALKDPGEAISSDLVNGWSYERWHKNFIIDKSIGGNCGIYTPYMYSILREAANVNRQLIYSAGNQAGGHTFLFVQNNRTWYILDPTYCGVWMMNDEPASLPVVLDFLRSDTVTPYKRFKQLKFRDDLYPSTIGVLVSKIDLWGIWASLKKRIEIYETNSYKLESFSPDNALWYHIANIPYQGSQKLYELRVAGNRMVPDGEGSAAYLNKEGEWNNEGMKKMFDAANLPTHFSSLLLLTKEPSLTGDQRLVKEVLEYFKKE